MSVALQNTSYIPEKLISDYLAEHTPNISPADFLQQLSNLSNTDNSELAAELLDIKNKSGQTLVDAAVQMVMQTMEMKGISPSDAKTTIDRIFPNQDSISSAVKEATDRLKSGDETPIKAETTHHFMGFDLNDEQFAQVKKLMKQDVQEAISDASEKAKKASDDFEKAMNGEL